MATDLYATTAELSAQTAIDLTKYSAHVTALLTAASTAINNACHRPDGFKADTNASARLFVGTGKSWLRINECVAITLVEMKNSVTDSAYVSLSASDWIPFAGNPKRPNLQPLATNEPKPYTGLMISLLSDTYSTFTSGLTSNALSGWNTPLDTSIDNMGQPTVRVTAKWGYAVAVPEAIRQATIIQASRFFKRSQAIWADALANADFGEVRFVKRTDPAYDYLVIHGFIKPGIG